jgi:hypothetical protein
MSNRTSFGDVELMLVGDGTNPGYLEAADRFLCTSTPPDLRTKLEAELFVVRVNRVGGGESRSGTSDEPRVRVDVFGLATSAAPRATHEKASEIRTQLRNLAGAFTEFGRLDKAVTEVGPTEMPRSSDEQIVRVQQVFRITTRP